LFRIKAVDSIRSRPKAQSAQLLRAQAVCLTTEAAPRRLSADQGEIMGRYAIKENDDGEYRLLEHDDSRNKWRRVADELDADELSDEIFGLLEDNDLEAEQMLIRVRADGDQEQVRAIDLVKPEQRRQLGYVISAQPVMRPPGDPAGRRRSL